MSKSQCNIWGCAYTKKFFIVYLKSKFHWCPIFDVATLPGGVGRCGLLCTTGMDQFMVALVSVPQLHNSCQLAILQTS